MKILFTGASSFSGMWFVRELAQAGHSITAIFQNPLESYQSLRRNRIDLVLSYCEPIFNCSFGHMEFMDVVLHGKSWDLFCHHAANVTHYKSPAFDPAAALMDNTKNLKQVLSQLLSCGCQHILLTGSVFEQNEGVGSDNLRAVSPYGLSKGLTSEVFKYYTEALQMKLGKFVIPNPFGPYEELRFTSYLIQNWFQKKTAVVHSPDYVRDNIPISLLAKSYVKFAEHFVKSSTNLKLNPSYYVESQGQFTDRMAKEMYDRLDLPCEYELKRQLEFVEPKIRTNTDSLASLDFNWNEKEAWDDLALYYQKTYQSCFCL